MKFAYKKYDTKEERMLAIADSDIVGKHFEEGDLQLEVTGEFYHESECGDEEALKMINDASLINATGNNIISLLLKENIIDEDKILRVGGVAHAQVIKL